MAHQMKTRPSLRRLAERLSLLLALGAAGGAGVAQAGRWFTKPDLFSHFAPFYAAAAITALGLWLATGRRRRWAAPLALLGLAGASVLMAPELVAASRQQRTAPREETLKIVQFNLLRGNWAPAKAAEWIIRQDADIVVVEEAQAGAGHILERLGPTYPHITPCISNQPCSARILSKRPFVDSPAVRGGRYVGSMASASFQGAKGPYTVVGVHYVWPDPLSPQEMNRSALIRALKNEPKQSLILAGDFNSTPWSFGLKAQDRQVGLERRTRALFSWSWKRWLPPMLPIDHIYAGSDWKTVSVKRGPQLGSDHRPVVIELTR